MIGQIVSQYKILEKLGEGGMGIVYKAHDSKLDRIVALKFLPERLRTSEAEKARFIQEARAASSINHPNVCTIHDIQEQDDHLFIVMEYVDGTTLRSKMPLQDIGAAVTIAIQIGEALQEAHGREIVHRDIKADNIMVNSKNQAKVMDFGLAKVKGSLKLTRTSSTVGTLAYMAPEQISGGEVDTRSDIFSYGVVLYELLTGRTAFRGEHEAAMVYSIVNEEPVPIEQFRSDIPPMLVNVILRALEKNPADRYQSVGDMVIELRRVLKQSTKLISKEYKIAAPTTGSQSQSVTGRIQQPVDTTTPSGPIGSRSILPFILGGAVVLVAAVAAFFFFRQSSGSSQIDSLAVLPFENSTTDPNAEYLTEGMTENITNKLSQLKGLRVVPRSLVAKYKGKEVDPREVGKDLNVSAVLTGKITQRGDALTVQTELIDIHNTSQLWGEQYSRKLADIMTIQDDIAGQVSTKLQPASNAGNTTLAGGKHVPNAEAYQLYLKGHFYAGKRTADGYKKALDFYHQAIDLDADFAMGYYGIAEAYMISLTIDGQAKDLMPKVKTAVTKALELDPTLGEGYATLAAEQAYYEFNFDAGEKSFQKAIELNPNYPTIHHWYGEYLCYMGRFDESLREYKRAVELDPASLPIASDFGLAYYYMHRFDESIDILKKAIEMDPNFVRSHFYIMQPLIRKGMNDQAFQQFITGLTVNGDSAGTIAEAKRIYAASGLQGIFRAFPTRTGRTAILLKEDKEKVLSTLEQLYTERSVFMVTLKVNPAFDEVRDEPRFKVLMKKMGFDK